MGPPIAHFDDPDGRTFRMLDGPGISSATLMSLARARTRTLEPTARSMGATQRKPPRARTRAYSRWQATRTCEKGHDPGTRSRAIGDARARRCRANHLASIRPEPRRSRLRDRVRRASASTSTCPSRTVQTARRFPSGKVQLGAELKTAAGESKRRPNSHYTSLAGARRE